MLSSAPRPNAIVPGPHGLTGEHADYISTPHPLHPNCESGPNYFPPNLFFFRARQAQNFATAIAASASRCQLHYIGRWPWQGCQGCRNEPKCGPKCGPKLDPNVWTQFSPIGIRTDGLQPNLGPQGIVARFRTTFGSTFWVHILSLLAGSTLWVRILEGPCGSTGQSHPSGLERGFSVWF